MGLCYLQPKWLWWDWFNNTIVVHEDHMHWKNRGKRDDGLEWCRLAALAAHRPALLKQAVSDTPSVRSPYCTERGLPEGKWGHEVIWWGPQLVLWLSLLYETHSELKLAFNFPFTRAHDSQEARASGRGGGPAPASASELLQPQPGFPGAADERFRNQIHLALFRN